MEKTAGRGRGDPPSAVSHGGAAFVPPLGQAGRASITSAEPHRDRD